MDDFIREVVMSNWADQNGTAVDTDLLRKLVKRVMDDGHMIRLQACTFVAGMFPGKTGWDVLRKIEGRDELP